MALRVGLKINRFLKLINRYKFQNVGQSYSQNSKQRCGSQQTKSASTLTKTQLKLKEEEEKLSSEQIPPQNNFVGAKKCMSDIPVITSDFANTEVTIRRKFAKSSTHNAITQPLKLPRLANPFPEPVKTLPSDTVSDDEKARLMQEQVKMEARYHLQMHQEMLLRNKQKRMNNNNFEQQGAFPQTQMREEQDQDTREHNQQPNFPQDDFQPENLSGNSFQQDDRQEDQQVYSNNFQNSNAYQQSFQESSHQPQNFGYHPPDKQPNYRKPKEYPQLSDENQQNDAPQKVAINTTEKNAEDLKENRPRHTRSRKKAHTRAARYLRNSWQPRNTRNQTRQYSTSINSITTEPMMMSEMEQCEKILEYLQKSRPEYRNLRKPILVPGSEEEKKFIKKILKINGQLKSEMIAKRHPAPFPSYSDVKTFLFTPESITSDDVSKKTVAKLAECFENRAKSRKSNRSNDYSPDNYENKKQTAPYPSYSEVYDDYEYDLVCKPSTSTNKMSSGSKPDNKYYSTSSGNEKKAKSSELEKQAKKKPVPCKSPFPPIPQCDYEETARKKKEKKRKKHCPKKKKKGKTSCSEDSTKIISKIKKWLSSYKPEENNIKVIRSPIDVDGRETYVIEVNEYEEIGRNEQSNSSTNNEVRQMVPEIVEIIQQHNDLKSVFPLRKKMPFKNLEYKPIEYKEVPIPEMTDPVPVLTNIPEFSSSSDNVKAPMVTPSEIKIHEVRTQEVKNLPAIATSATTETSQNVPVVVSPPSTVIPIKSNEITLKEVEQKIDANEKEVNKLKEIFLTRNKDTTKINVVRDLFQMKPKPVNTKVEMKKTENNKEAKPDKSKNDVKISRFKNMREQKNQQRKNADNKQNKFRDFRVKNWSDVLGTELQESRPYKKISHSPPLPEPCPIITRKLPSFCSPKKEDCNNSTEKDGCKIRKTRKDECPPQKKCRYRKKRKVPKCDDVKGNKNCMPQTPFYYTPNSERKYEYLSKDKRKSLRNRSDKISNFINLKSEDVDMLAQESANENFEPFKLKSQFWKK